MEILASLSDMSRVEKEEYVIRLYKENKSTREIAKIMHMSFGGIGAITKKVKLEADRERGQLEEDDDIKSKSKTTQAITLFSELKTPVEVAIALDLPADQVPSNISRILGNRRYVQTSPDIRRSQI